MKRTLYLPSHDGMSCSVCSHVSVVCLCFQRKKHNYADGDDGDMPQDGKDSGPTWGLDYQMSNRRGPAFSRVEQGYGRGSKGYLTPPVLNDSPSDYSDEE